VTKLGFSRSLDSGRSFDPVRVIVDTPENVVAGPMAAAGPDGAVYAIYGVWPLPEEVSDQKDKDQAGARSRPEIAAPIRVVCSTDQGQTFGQPVELGVGTMEVKLADDVTSPALPAIAVDWVSGTVYATFVTRQTGADHSVVVVASTDRGKTWSAPAPIAANPGRVFYFQPQITVDDAGRVGVSAFALEHDRVDVDLFVAEPDTLRFAPPVRVTSQPFDPARGTLSGGSKHGAWWIGDYQGLAASSGAFHPFWNDTRTGQLEIFTALVTGA
jgi:hypothetical protein